MPPAFGSFASRNACRPTCARRPRTYSGESLMTDDWSSPTGEYEPAPTGVRTAVPRASIPRPRSRSARSTSSCAMPVPRARAVSRGCPSAASTQRSQSGGSAPHSGQLSTRSILLPGGNDASGRSGSPVRAIVAEYVGETAGAHQDAQQLASGIGRYGKSARSSSVNRSGLHSADFRPSWFSVWQLCMLPAHVATYCSLMSDTSR